MLRHIAWFQAVAEFEAAVKAGLPPKRVRQMRRNPAPIPRGPVEKRRSGRLANVAPVEYSEAALLQADGKCDGLVVSKHLPQGPKSTNHPTPAHREQTYLLRGTNAPARRRVSSGGVLH